MISRERLSRDIEILRTFTATPGSGVTRLSYTKEEALAREYIKNRMQEAGLTVREHPTGNIIGRMAGRDDSLAPVMTGSHYDTVLSGGAYDGVAGVVTAIEAAHSFKEEGFVPERPIEVIAFVEEEGSRFHHGLLGSEGLIGNLTKEAMLSAKDNGGICAYDAMKAAGHDPDAIPSHAIGKGDLHAFVELHIEQGPVLENEGTEIGIVTCINSMNYGHVTVKGRADHAGTTPMDARVDALRGAAVFMERFYALAEALGNTTATVGKMDVYPGSANVVPGEVAFTVDFRSTDMTRVKRMHDFVRESADNPPFPGISMEFHMLSEAPATDLDEEIQSVIETEAGAHGFSTKRMPSGAGHDAMNMATVCPTGMIFIPSTFGSHNPKEFASEEAIEKGAKVLANTLKRLAK